MNDPRISALICTLVAAWLGYTIFFGANEAPSTFLAVVQWTFLLVAILGAVAAVIRIIHNSRR
jgi:TRAP-type C4-dicarboxylate transport system permease small subunit